MSNPEPAPVNADQIAYWNSAVGERWAALHTRLDGIFALLTATAMDFAAVQPGSSVLDVGCGSGATVLSLSKAVGPTGHVHGVDVSKPMLAIAEQRVAAERLSNVTLSLADAATFPFPPKRFDLAFSRFGVMFFADPVAAFANIRTALAPSGRLAFACWQPLSVNPWFEVPIAALRPFQPPAAPADPFAPGPFAFADPDRVRSILDAAGFESVRIEPHGTSMNLGTVQDALDFVTRIGPASRTLADADPQARPAMIEALRMALTAQADDDGVELAGAIWLVATSVPG